MFFLRAQLVPVVIKHASITRPSPARTINKYYSASIKFTSCSSCHIMLKAIRFDTTSDAYGPWTWTWTTTWTCPRYQARSATFSPAECGKYGKSARFDSVWFRSVPFSVPLFVCSLGNSEKKTEMHLFIAGQHAMQACQSGQAGRQAGKLTYIEFREHFELLIITNRAYIVYIPTIYICTCPCLTSHARTSQSSVWFMLIDKFTH